MDSIGWGRGSGGGMGVHARHRLDISVDDIWFGVFACWRVWRRDLLEDEVLGLCSMQGEGLVCFSVRSGWDLWLRALGLGAGDEVIVSAVTHPDMVGIIRRQGLRAVPVDIDPETLAPHLRVLEAALTPRTRVVLVAHLFGGRMDLGPIIRWARRRGLFVAEDCAQAYQGPENMGDTGADVCMYSFGTLKTSTALGGAVLRVRNKGILQRMREVQGEYPVQQRSSYAKKLLKALVILVVSRPRSYGLLARACAWFGFDLDALVNGVVRAYPVREPQVAYFRRVRHRPCAPLLAMLIRRLRTFDEDRLARRALAGERFASRLRVPEVHPGQRSLARTHWLFPAVVPDPEALILGLRKQGLDASQATSSIAVAEGSDDSSSPTNACRLMAGVVFLPVYPGLPPQDLDTMVDIVNDHVVGEPLENAAS